MKLSNYYRRGVYIRGEDQYNKETMGACCSKVPPAIHKPDKPTSDPISQDVCRSLQDTTDAQVEVGDVRAETHEIDFYLQSFTVLMILSLHLSVDVLLW